MEYDKQFKYYESLKKGIREEAIKDLQKADYEEISLSKREIPLFNDESFLKWVETTFPEMVDKVTKVMIDYEKFEKAVALGEIIYDEIPPEVYKIRTDYVITIKRNKE